MSDGDVMEKIKILLNEIYSLLCEKKITVATAESCTGGMIGASLTSVPGISEYYGYGFVTYSNEAKTRLIGVKTETLEAFGAVSSNTAIEMAEGALNVSGADIAVSVTGIAGPGGGTLLKPVGLVYVGCATKNGKRFFEKLNLGGTRDEIRIQTVQNALAILKLRIEQYR